MEQANDTAGAPVHSMVMPRLSAGQRKLLESYHFHQGEVGDGTGCTCEECDRPCGGKRGWWLRTSCEYDEWSCNCRVCALDYCERYETFDADQYQRTAQSA